jgi:hypothetical protein
MWRTSDCAVLVVLIACHCDLLCSSNYSPPPPEGRRAIERYEEQIRDASAQITEVQ